MEQGYLPHAAVLDAPPPLKYRHINLHHTLPTTNYRSYIDRLEQRTTPFLRVRRLLALHILDAVAEQHAKPVFGALVCAFESTRGQ